MHGCDGPNLLTRVLMKNCTPMALFAHGRPRNKRRLVSCKHQGDGQMSRSFKKIGGIGVELGGGVGGSWGGSVGEWRWGEGVEGVEVLRWVLG